MSHRLLCVHRGVAVGAPHHLQDPEELPVPAGNEEWDDELRTRVRDPSGRVPLLHPGYGQGAKDVPAQGRT